MKVSAPNRFLETTYFLEESKITGISRLREIELINRSKEDITQFKTLYEIYYPQILNYIYQKVTDREVAADITSQVFLKAMTNLKKYKIQAAPFSAWLYRIAFNDTMLYFRKSKKTRTVVLDEALLEGIRDELEDFPKEQILTAIEGILDYLKPHEFELIELRYYKGKSFKEIGCILNCSENTAKVRSHRVVKKLKNELLKRNRHETI